MLKIKSTEAERRVAFTGDTQPKVKLAEKSQANLKKLAIIALEANHSTLLELFEGDLQGVKLEDLKKEETAAAVAKAAEKAPEVKK